MKKMIKSLMAAIGVALLMTGSVFAATTVTTQVKVDAFGDNTVYDGTTYYDTLQKAVEAVCGTAGATLYCKPGADVGSLQHAPVTATLTIYGNGAYVSGGSERDFDIGNTDPSGGKDIAADMTLTVKDLDGCGAWGAKATAHTVNLVFEDCQNMGKVFITGTTGTLNITIKDSSFEGVIKEAVYSNADGAITLTNVDFSNLNKAVNLNHKAAGTQTVTITDCSFTDCGADVANDQIPVRVLSSVDGGKSVLTVSGTTFTGTPEGGADILLDYGVGETTANISTAGTAANIVVEKTNNVGTTTTIPANTHNQSFATVEPVAKIGTMTFKTFAEALTAAKAMTGDVTVEIYEKVTLNTSLSGSYSSITFVGKDTDAEIYLEVQGYITATGKTVNFQDLKLSKSQGGFITNAGFMNTAFGVYDVMAVNYTNCTFSNGAYASSGTVTFTKCIFKRSWDKYGLWAYGDVNCIVDECTFDDYRGIKMYAEGAAKTTDLTVKNSDFSAVTDKPAIVLTYGESVNLEGNTYSSTGTFELDLDGAPNGVAVTSDVAPICKNDNGACGVLVDGKIYTTVAQAAEVATASSTVTLLHNSTETVELPEGVTLDKNGFTADGVTVKQPAKNIEVTDANGNVTYYAGFTGFKDLDLVNCTIKLLADVSDANLILNKGDDKVVLDLNGFIFSRAGSSSGAINLSSTGKLIIRDTSAAKTGKIVADTYVVWMMNGDFVLESGTIETTSTKNAAIYANAAEVAINDGKIISAGDAITVGENFIESRGASTIAISGGEIVAAGVGIKNGSYAQDSTAVTVTGGTIDSEGDSISFTKGSVQVSGGTFSSDVSDYCVDGFEVKQNADGTYGVAANPAYGKVAKIGENYYETLSATFAAVTDDSQTVTILKDVTENLTGAYLRGNITTENDAKVTINLTNSDWLHCPYTFVLGANVTLKCPALFYYAGGTQINGTLIVDAYYQRYTGTKLTINEPGSMTVTGETFILRYTDGDANAGIYINGDNDDSTIGLKASVIYFYQGMINANNANIQAATYWQTNETDNQGSANLVLDNSTLTVSVYEHPAKATGNSTVTLKNSSRMNCTNGGITFDENAVVNIDASSSIIGKNGEEYIIPVAKIGSVKYTSLQAALAAAQAGDTIVLLADVTCTEKPVFSNGGIVNVDVNGHVFVSTETARVRNVVSADGKVPSNNIKFVSGFDWEVYQYNGMPATNVEFRVFPTLEAAVTYNPSTNNPARIYPYQNVTQEADVTLKAYPAGTSSTICVDPGYEIVWDLNGYTVLQESPSGNPLEACIRGKFTLKDSSDEQTGKWIAGACGETNPANSWYGNGGPALYVLGEGELVLEGGTISIARNATLDTAGNEIVNSGGLIRVDGGKLNVNGATLQVDDTYGVMAWGGEIEINAGTFDIDPTVSVPVYAIGYYEDVAVEVNSTFDGALCVYGNVAGFKGASAMVNVAGVEYATGDGWLVPSVGEGLMAFDGLVLEKGVAVVKSATSVNSYTTFADAVAAAAAGTGNVTVEILSDIDLTGTDWNPVTVSAPGYPFVTVNGNNKTITGLNDMLFAGTWAGKSGLVINDLTIAESTIVNDGDDTKGTVGVGAFIGFPQASATVTLNNCHLRNSTVNGGHWTGGLIGYAAGYAGTDGPVFMTLTITNCSVTASTITGKGSAGGIIGHGSGNAWTDVIIVDSVVSGNTITSTGSSNNKAGSVMGTIGAAGQPTTVNGVTKTGGMSVSVTTADNTVKSADKVITTIYGRQGTETGLLEIAGGTYEAYPIEENVEYAAPKDGYIIFENTDGKYGVKEGTYVAQINGVKYETLASALVAAQADDVITFLCDVEQEDGVVITDKKVKIDLNGKTFTVSNGGSTNNRNFKINGASEVVISNGTMVAAGDYSSGAYGTVRTEGTAKVELQDLKLYNYRGNGLNVKACTGTSVTMTDVEIYAQYGGGVESAGGTVELTDVVVQQKGMYTAPYNSMAISVNGGGTVIVQSGTYSTECLTAEEANNQGTSHGPWVAGVLNSGGTLIINGGTFSNDNFGENSLATYARGAILADTAANIQINGGTFNALKAIVDIQNNLGNADKNPSCVLAGGTFSADPCVSANYGSNLITVKEGYLCAEQNSNPVTYKVGKLPSAEVINLGPVVVGPEGDFTFGDNYYVYDLVGTQKMTTSSDPFDLQIALNFIAKDTVAQAEKNAFGNYTTDFYITIDGIADGSSFVADEDCYLAGYYPSFNAWVKIPLTGFTIEDGKVYPVITSAGFNFKYTDICGSVGDFICGIHLSDAVLQVNPDLKVKLELGLSKTYDDALAADKFIRVDQPYEYDVEDMTSAVAVTGPDYYTTVTGAVEAALETGDYVKLVKNNAGLEDNLEINRDLVFNLGGKTLAADGKTLTITDSVVTITNGTLSAFTKDNNITLTGNAVLTVTDANVAASFRSADTYYVSQNANDTYSIMLKSAFRVFITMVDGEPRIGFFQDCAQGAAACTLLGATSLENADWTNVVYTPTDDASGASELPLFWVKLDQAADDTNVYRFFKIGPAPVNEQID